MEKKKSHAKYGPHRPPASTSRPEGDDESQEAGTDEKATQAMGPSPTPRNSP